MLLIIVAVVIGVGIGSALRPRTTRFARPRVRSVGWLVGGVVAEVASSRMSGMLAVVLGVGALLALTGFSLANLHLTGMGVLAIGLGCHLLAMSANGGMPVSRHALVAAGVVNDDDVAAVDLAGPRHLERTGDALLVLGDIIPAHGRVVSFGDLIIAVAAADVIVHVTRRQRRRQVVAASSISSASPVHDWGIAPSPVPSFASQYSASPDADAPRMLELATSAPDRHSK